MARLGTSLSTIEATLSRLSAAIDADLPPHRCLRRWSEFIRELDGHRCVDCHGRANLSAHHICRKSFLPEARYHSGNGITLCRACHKDVHQGFNGRADLSLPMDAQGGEKLEVIERLYCILMQDGEERGIWRDDLYYLSDAVLSRFKLFQGFDPDTLFPGPRIQQAYLIWAQTGLNTRRALAEANGLPMADQPILPGEAYIVFSGGGRTTPQTAILSNDYWYRHELKGKRR